MFEELDLKINLDITKLMNNADDTRIITSDKKTLKKH